MLRAFPRHLPQPAPGSTWYPDDLFVFPTQQCETLSFHHPPTNVLNTMPRSYDQPSQPYGHQDRNEMACQPDASESRRRPAPQFFLNSTGVSPALQPSYHRDDTGMTLSSLPSSPSYSRRTSRASLAALRTALQHYQISPEDETRPIFASSSDQPVILNHDERMDALVDIHRVLYRGKEDLDGKALSWNEQGQEVRRVVERWFEADCCELRIVAHEKTSADISIRPSTRSNFVTASLLDTFRAAPPHINSISTVRHTVIAFVPRH